MDANAPDARTGEPRAVVRHFDDVAPAPCPCGETRRIGFGDGAPASVHRVAVRCEARLHVHERLAETYVVLRGEGEIELSGERFAVRAGSVIHIPPGVPHALRGDFDILNFVVPPFDPADERLLE